MYHGSARCNNNSSYHTLQHVVTTIKICGKGLLDSSFDYDGIWKEGVTRKKQGQENDLGMLRTGRKSVTRQLFGVCYNFLSYYERVTDCDRSSFKSSRLIINWPIMRGSSSPTYAFWGPKISMLDKKNRNLAIFFPCFLHLQLSQHTVIQLCVQFSHLSSSNKPLVAYTVTLWISDRRVRGWWSPRTLRTGGFEIISISWRRSGCSASMEKARVARSSVPRQVSAEGDMNNIDTNF